MPRLFVAIDLPESHQRPGAPTLRQDDLPPGRWARREALHLTLHFIGDVPEAVARAYARALRQVDAPAFELRISPASGQFPIEERPRVIWAGVQNTPALRALLRGGRRGAGERRLPARAAALPSRISP